MKLRVIDTETCGVEEPDLQMVEVATADIEDKGVYFDLGNQWSTIINPGRVIPYEAMAVHHITDTEASAYPVISSPLSNVKEKIAEGSPDYFIAHNARFDSMVLRANGIDIRVPWLCTYKAAVVLFPTAPSHKNQVLRYYLDLSVPNWAVPHRASGDVLVTEALAIKILNQISVEEWEKISAGPVLLPKVHFGEHANKPWSAVPRSYLNWILFKSRGEWDEDILHTARHYYAASEPRSRSPV